MACLDFVSVWTQTVSPATKHECCTCSPILINGTKELETFDMQVVRKFTTSDTEANHRHTSWEQQGRFGTGRTVKQKNKRTSGERG